MRHKGMIIFHLIFLDVLHLICINLSRRTKRRRWNAANVAAVVRSESNVTDRGIISITFVTGAVLAVFTVFWD